MADNLTTQSATPATPPAGTVIASRSVTYSGDANAQLAPSVLVTLSGADDAKVATDVDQTNPLPTTPGQAATATGANIAGSASAVTLQAANANRKGWTVFNDSTAVLYVKFGSGASATDFAFKLPAGDYYEMPAPLYVGLISGIWASATGAARVVEFA